MARYREPQNHNGVDAIISRLENIERTIDNLGNRIHRLEYHFGGDCDVLSRLDTLENQVVGSVVDKAVFDTKLSTHRDEQARLLGGLRTEIDQVYKEIDESKTATAVSIHDYSGTTEGAISNIWGELNIMQAQFSSFAVTLDESANKDERTNESDLDEAWADDEEAGHGSANASVTAGDDGVEPTEE